MALSTYSELKTSIASWLNRADLVAAIPDFITLAEADFNTKLRARQMQQRSIATFEDQYTSLPADYLEMTSLIMLTEPVTKLEFFTQQRIQDLKAQNWPGGVPKYFTIIGDTIEISPVVGTNTGEMIYFKQIASLSADNPSNWLLTKRPDVYLYGSLIHSAPFLKDDARATVWATLYQNGLDSMKVESDNATHGGQLIMRTR